MYTISAVVGHRRELFATTLHELKGKYAATMLGFVWPVVFPLLFLSAYALVFLYVFKVKPADLTSKEYLLVVFTGLVPFLGFSEALSNGTSSVIENKGLVKNTMFPIELVPVKAVLLGKVTMLVGLIFVVIYLAVTGKVTLHLLGLPLVLLLHLAFAVGLAWLISSIAVVVRDIAQVVSVSILMLMLLSPIAYLPSMVPPQLLLLFSVNPLYYIISAYRWALLGLPMSNQDSVIFVVMCIGSLLLGGWFFARMKTVFADFL